MLYYIIGVTVTRASARCYDTPHYSTSIKEIYVSILGIIASSPHLGPSHWLLLCRNLLVTGPFGTGCTG